jgi:hypothetical protein
MAQPSRSCARRRLHAAPAGAGDGRASASEAGAAPRAAAGPAAGGDAGATAAPADAAAREDAAQRAHEVNIAAQALAVLVRLTAHAGAPPPRSVLGSQRVSLLQLTRARLRANTARVQPRLPTGAAAAVSPHAPCASHWSQGPAARLPRRFCACWPTRAAVARPTPAAR